MPEWPSVDACDVICILVHGWLVRMSALAHRTEHALCHPNGYARPLRTGTDRRRRPRSGRLESAQAAVPQAPVHPAASPKASRGIGSTGGSIGKVGRAFCVVILTEWLAALRPEHPGAAKRHANASLCYRLAYGASLLLDSRASRPALAHAGVPASDPAACWDVGGERLIGDYTLNHTPFGTHT